ncbi:hypothetical protein Tco_0546549 [Tanacetum coccineum]
MIFYQMDTEEVSDRFVAPCFINGPEAYDGEINLGVEENMISNEYAVKLCLEHEVKRGNKVVKKEIIVALRGEIYFLKFIINPKKDDIELGVIFSRSFLCMTKAITDFGFGTVIIYHDIDPFLEETEEEEKSNNDWDHLLDFNIDDIPLLGEEGLPPFVCKMGKSSRNKKQAMETRNFFYQDIGTSSSTGGHLTQEEATKEALAIRISQKFGLLESITRYGVSTSIRYSVSSSLSNTAYSLKLIYTAYPLPLDTAYRLSGTEAEILCMTRSSTNKLFKPYKEPKREFRSSRRHFKTLSLDELRSPDFNLLSDQEYSEEEEAEAMAETMEQYMSKTRTDYGLGVRIVPKNKGKG